MDILTTILLGVIGSLIAAYLYDYFRSRRLGDRTGGRPSLFKHGFIDWLLQKAVKPLPKRAQARYFEEWSAHLASCPGKASKLCCVVEFFFCAPALAKALRKESALLAWATRRLKRDLLHSWDSASGGCWCVDWKLDDRLLNLCEKHKLLDRIAACGVEFPSPKEDGSRVVYVPHDAYDRVDHLLREFCKARR